MWKLFFKWISFTSVEVDFQFACKLTNFRISYFTKVSKHEINTKIDVYTNSFQKGICAGTMPFFAHILVLNNIPIFSKSTHLCSIAVWKFHVSSTHIRFPSQTGACLLACFLPSQTGACLPNDFRGDVIKIARKFSKHFPLVSNMVTLALDSMHFGILALLSTKRNFRISNFDKQII